ncbi:histidine kinase [Pedobacter sp. N36a]|nr:histidine kinase [Pedobacter sp. N36a]
MTTRTLSSLLRDNYRTLFALSSLFIIFYVSKLQGYLLFHILVELFSIVVAFAVFIVTWNSRKMQDNGFLHLVGISYLFIGALDLLHTLTYMGMQVIAVDGFPGNQFWVTTRMMEALTLVVGLVIARRRIRLNSDLVFLGYFGISLVVVLAILVWKVFPVCYVQGIGQTPFKLYIEYAIIAVLLVAAGLLIGNRKRFSSSVFRLLLVSMCFTVLSECCFASYQSNTGLLNEIGHYFKLVSFFLIYKVNVETGFIRPTDLIFKDLKESEQKYRTLAENLPGIVLRLDTHFRCIYANRSGYFGMGPDSLDGDLSGFELFVSLQPVLQRAGLSGERQMENLELNGPTGTEFHAVQVIPEKSSMDRELSYLVICNDITGLKRTHVQLQELNDTKDKLFSIIAHDLKNPFTSLLTYSELIYRKFASLERSKIEHMAFRINDSTKQAYALLENLLKWSSIQTGLLRPAKEVLSVRELLGQLQGLMGSVAQQKGIALIIEKVVETSILADRQMVDTVLRNLVSNALKFSFQNGKVEISVESAEGFALFSIADTGTGIPLENQAKLMEVGNRFSSVGTASESGTGLGLVLCREFVELNDGKIYFQSEFGEGTTFFFTLPIA